MDAGGGQGIVMVSSSSHWCRGVLAGEGCLQDRSETGGGGVVRVVVWGEGRVRVGVGGEELVLECLREGGGVAGFPATGAAGVVVLGSSGAGSLGALAHHTQLREGAVLGQKQRGIHLQICASVSTHLQVIILIYLIQSKNPHSHTNSETLDMAGPASPHT